MHRALLRSDIAFLILQELLPDWEADDNSYLSLYNCALVNKLFFHEAIRILWLGCGGHTPGIRYLGILARQDIKRAQIYAHHITYLEFELFEDGGKEGNYGPITFDVEYLDVFTSLTFPKLERVTIYGTGEVIHDHLLECYLQSQLESFALQGEFQGTLDTFLDLVRQRCPQIKNLNIECKGTLTVRIGTFLEQPPQLEGFSLPPAQSEWSQENFKSICGIHGLKQLHVPHIDAPWLHELETGWPELDQLRTTLSNEAVEQLQQLAPALGIMELKIRSTPPPSDVFVRLSQFTLLRSLDVTLMRTEGLREHCIEAHSLVILAKKCPELFIFHISGENGHPSIYGLTDKFFEDLTRNLSKVEEFIFDVDDTSSLTLNAILALGKHCKKLWQAKISCDIDWTDDLGPSLQDDVLFPTLSGLELVSRGQRVSLEEWTDRNRARFCNFADKFVRSAPELSSVEISGENDADEFVNRVLNDAIDRREADEHR